MVQNTNQPGQGGQGGGQKPGQTSPKPGEGGGGQKPGQSDDKR